MIGNTHGHGDFQWKISARLPCHTIAERHKLILCPKLFWPSHQMFLHTTHHIILSLDQGISHGKMYFTLLLFHICSEYFSAWYYAGSISLLLLDSLQKQHQFPVLVAQENIQINSREGVFFILLILMKVKNHFQNIKKQHCWELPALIAVKIFWLKFHGENLPLASAQFSFCSRPKL